MICSARRMVIVLLDETLVIKSNARKNCKHCVLPRQHRKTRCGKAINLEKDVEARTRCSLLCEILIILGSLCAPFRSICRLFSKVYEQVQ